MVSAEEKRKRAAEYAKKRRRENPDARSKHVAAVVASAKKRREKDPAFVEAQRAYQVAYHKKRSADPEYMARRRANVKALRNDPSYVERHRAKVLAADRARSSSPQRRAAARERYKRPAVKLKQKLTGQRRRARLRDSCSPGVTPAQWAEICGRYSNENGDVACAYCKKACAATVDHVVPIARGGRDEPTNVVPCCRFCNTSKGARFLSEWHRAPTDFRSLCPQNNNQILPAG